MYDKKYKEFRAKQEQIKTKLSNLENADETYYLTVTYLLQLASKAPELFKRSEMQQKRELLQLTLQNLVLKGDKLEFNLLKPFDLLLDLSKSGLWLRLLGWLRLCHCGGLGMNSCARPRSTEPDNITAYF